MDTKLWGLFTWRQDGRYLQETPHKVYRSERAADKAANAHYETNPEDNWVSRSYWVAS